MVYLKNIKLVMVLTAAASFIACSSQARYQGADTEHSLRNYEKWQQTQINASSSAYLTDLVKVDGLDLLISKALANNPSLQQVHTSLKIAQAQGTVTSADKWFKVTANADANRTENATTEYSTSLAVSWEADIWQKIADNVAAQDMTIFSNEASYQAAKDALVASIMRSYLNIVLQQNLLEIEQRRLVVLTNNELSIVERYQSGLGDLEALDTARTNTSITRSTIASYEEEIAKAKRDLMLLVGSDDLDYLSVVQGFPKVLQPLSSLPEQDLARRPDLQSAYFDIQSKRYLVDAAYKDLLPSISLSGSLSDIASSPSQALLTSPLWNLLGSLSAPLFEGGKLRAQVEIAKLNAEQSFWSYQDTLLNAVNEVENALGQEHSLTQQQQYMDIALQSAERSYDNYLSKYQQGLVDILDLLTVQQQVYDLEATLAQIHFSLLTNRIDLGLALGLGVAS